jgi:REP element-mobilizing transposase RayT
MPAPRTDRPFRQPTRLESAAYADRDATFHATIGAYPQTSPFRDEFGARVWSELQAQRENHRVQLHAACLMPDHLHLLLTAEELPVDRWIGAFKSYTTKLSWTYGGRGRLWQPSFHDRALRNPAEFEAAVDYLWRNPVTASLVDEGDEWPWLLLPDEM